MTTRVYAAGVFMTVVGSVGCYGAILHLAGLPPATLLPVMMLTAAGMSVAGVIGVKRWSMQGAGRAQTFGSQWRILVGSLIGGIFATCAVILWIRGRSVLATIAFTVGVTIALWTMSTFFRG